MQTGAGRCKALQSGSGSPGPVITSTWYLRANSRESRLAGESRSPENCRHRGNVQKESAMKVLRMPEVVATTGLSRMTIYRLEERGQFPPRLRLSANTVGWRESDIARWMESLPTGGPATPEPVTATVSARHSERGALKERQGLRDSRRSAA
jgi:prophage regulatory protein